MNAINIRHVKIEPYGVDSCGPDSVLDFYLPGYGFIDLSTLIMFFNFAHSDTGTGNTRCLTRDSESIIQTLEVYVNGTLVNQINNYQQVFRILSDYSFDNHEVSERNMFRNCMTNGNPTPSTAANVRETYCCKKWLGWLGCNEVVDLNKNKVHIRITTSPRFVIAGPGANDTYSLSNIYMSARCYETYDGLAQKTIVYDDFKSQLVQNFNNVDMSIKVISDNVDYACAFFLQGNYRQIFTSLFEGSTRFVTRSTGNIDSWNFTVNGRYMYSYDVPLNESQMTMLRLFPDGFYSISPHGVSVLGISGFTTSGNGFKFAAGCPIGFRSDSAEEIEVTFLPKISSPLAVINTPCCMFIKYNKVLTLN